MRFTLKERRVLVRSWAKQYQRAGRKQKTVLLDGFVEATGYSRNHAGLLLRYQGRQLYWKGKRFRAEIRVQGQKRGRKTKYGEQVQRALVQIWEMLDYLCSKRLAAVLPEVIAQLERFGELHVSRATRQLLLQISPASIDRRLRPERQKFQLRGRSHTKPGTLRKFQVPLKQFADWKPEQPGFLEIDLVAHEGGQARGDFAQTLDVTDLYSGWTECQAVQNKAQVWVFEALQQILERLPFPVLGLASDNGAEFINDYLIQYCSRHQITFCRSRAYRKNDNCHVEQKNYSVVRRAVGYQRFDTSAQLELLNQLYQRLRLQVNFFNPQMKLLRKERHGSRIRRLYDRPQTPYQRLLASPAIPANTKRQLQRCYQSLNPALLHRQISGLRLGLIYGWSCQNIETQIATLSATNAEVTAC